MPKKINSLQLAKLCGVSQGTVHRALYNKGRIKEETRKLVLETAKKHNYCPNPLANEMIRGKSHLVGAILPIWDAPFYIDLMNLVQRKLEKQALTLLLATAENTTSFQRILSEFHVRRFKALIIIPPLWNAHDYVKSIQQDIRPIALISPLKGCRNILPDEEQCGRLGTEYLWQKGHRKIIRIHQDIDAWAFRARNEGYRQAMEAFGLSPVFFPVNSYSASFSSDIENMLATHHPTALFCHNDPLAQRVISILGQIGLRVPQDISVMGTDSNPSFLQINPDIDSLVYPMDKIAEQCVKVITEELRGTPRQKPPFELHEGRTISQATLK